MGSLNNTIKRLKAMPALASLTESLPPSMKARLRRTADRFSRPTTASQILAQTSQTNDLLARMVYERAFETPRFQEEKRLLRYGFKVYSQHDEDGMIEEIFRRIGVRSRFFVEFGVGDGLENCTLYLLLKNWKGAWIDGSADCFEKVQRQFGFLIAGGSLAALRSFITAENIEQLFERLNVPLEFDLLSIDIDRNDFWVWKAIEKYSPRVVAIEYIASFKQTASCTVPYSPTATWDGSNFTGSSLKALERLAREKGYALVGCAYTGVTAFFVREDCLGDHFAQPYTSENHYEPARYFVRMPNGHPPGFGPFVSIGPTPDV